MIRFSEEIAALVSLLDDPDSSVQIPVIERLIEHGEPAVKVLEHTWEASANISLQERIENVILLIQREVIRKELKDWSDCRGDRLIYGAYLIAKSQYPDLQFSEIESRIEELRSQIWLEMNGKLTAMEKVRLINHFLFTVNKFNRSIRGVQSPQLFLVNHVLDTHKGLPVSLSVIYATIAEHLELPVYCVDLPHNFLLCYHDPTYLDDPDGIMFYINPYSQGTILGRSEVEHFLKQQNLELKPEYMRPCSNIETIERLAEGLRFAYVASRMEDKASFLEELIELLKSGRSDQIL
jgi:regulator of sirC expression with transglutaminase-like and TPR domain